MQNMNKSAFGSAVREQKIQGSLEKEKLRNLITAA